MRARVAALVFVLLFVTSPVFSLDRFLRLVATAEAIAPAALLFTQGVDTPLEAGILGGAVVLHTLPNIVLLVAEGRGDGLLTRLARSVSAGAGLGTAGAGLGAAVALEAGLFEVEEWRAYAPSLAATAVPALFAGLVDLVPYSVEAALGAGSPDAPAEHETP